MADLFENASPKILHFNLNQIMKSKFQSLIFNIFLLLYFLLCISINSRDELAIFLSPVRRFYAQNPI